MLRKGGQEMPSPRFAIFKLLSALAPLFAAGCGDSAPQGCKTETCTSGAWIHIPLTVAASVLAQAKVTACRNGECHDWLLPSLPAGGQEAFPDAPFLMGVLRVNSDQSIGLDIQWTLDAIPGGTGIDAGSPMADGDHYVVILTSSGGLASTLLDQVATYEPYAPNGPDCPPICTQAVLSV
jgi:hypothetical protein